MIRSIPTLKRFGLPILVVALVVVVSIVAYALNNRPLIPPTGASEPIAQPASVYKTIDLGAGYTLVLEGAQGKIIAPDTIIKYGPKMIDLGAGYTLVLEGAQGKIIAPDTIIKYGPKMIDLGAGYTLVLNATDGKIVAPART